MKKILTLSCIIALLLNICAYADISNGETSDNRNYVKLINDLGLFPENYKNDDANDKNVNRIEFAETVLRVLNFNYTDYSGSKSMFSDIESDFYGVNIISSVCQLGLMNGYPDGSFRASESIEYAEAVKVLLDAMGYRKYAEVKGGYPAGYLAYARRLGLDSGMNKADDDILTVGDLSYLIYNALDVDLMELTSIGEDEGYSITKGVNLLTRYHDIYTADGNVNSTEYSDMDISGIKNSEHSVIIGSESYDAGETDAEEYLGYSVRIYYQQNEESNAKVIKHIEKNSSNMNITQISSDDIISYENSNLKYYSDDRTKSISIPPAANVIYNGMYVKSEERKSAVTEKSNSIELIKIDGSINALKITAYSTYVASVIDKENKRLYGRYNSEYLNFDDSVGEVIAKDEFGNPLSINDIRVNDVLTVERSFDGSVVKAVLTAKSVKGSIQQIKKENGRTNLFISGAYVKLSRELQDYNRIADIGTFCTFYLNNMGEIAYIDEDYSRSEELFGYLVDATTVSDGFNSTAKLKIFDETGKMKYLSCSETVLVDGERVKDNPIRLIETLKLRAAGNSVGQAVIYKTNKENKVDSIDTSYFNRETETYNTLKRQYAAAKGLIYKPQGKTFSGKMVIKNTTKVLRVPVDPTTDDIEYKLSDFNYFISDGTYIINAFAKNQNELGADYIILFLDDNNSGVRMNSCEYSMVSEIVQAVDDEGYISDRVTVIQNGQEYKYYTASSDVLKSVRALNDADDKLYDIGVGDMIRYTTNGKGRINSVRIAFDNTDKTVKVSNPSAAYTSEYRFYSAAVYSKWSDLIAVTNNLDNPAPDEMEIHDLSKYSIYHIDKDDKYIRVDKESVKDYLNYKSDYSKVLIVNRYGNPRSIFIYE